MKSFLILVLAMLPAMAFGQWRQLPGPSGGSVNDICEIAGSNGALLYAATSDGVYRSEDHAGSWERIGLAHQNVKWIVQYAAAGPVMLFAALEGANSRWRVCRSEDSGYTWDTVFSQGAVVGIEQDGNDIVLGTGLVNSDSAQGIFRSTDQGQHWTHQAVPPHGFFTSFLLENGFIFGVTEDSGVWEMPKGGSTWARTSYPYWHHAYSIRTNGSELFVGGRGRIDISTDQGRTWLKPPNQGMDTLSPLNEITSFDVNGVTMVASTDGNAANGIFRSVNGGGIWQNISGLNGMPRADFASAIRFVDNSFLVASPAGLVRSTDAMSWQYATSGLPSTVGDVAASGSMLFATTPRGIFRSTDRGETWIDPSGPNDLEDSLAASFLSIGGNLYATAWPSQFGGTIGSGLWQWDSNRWNTVSDFQISSLAAYGSFLFGAAGSSGVLASSDHGNTWRNASSGLPLGSGSAAVLIPTEDRLIAVLDGLSAPAERAYWYDTVARSWQYLAQIDHVSEPLGGVYANKQIYLVSNGVLSVSSDDGATWASSTDGAVGIRLLRSQAIMTSPDSIVALRPNGDDLLLLDTLTGTLNSFGFDSLWVYAATVGRGIWAAPISSLPLSVPAERATLQPMSLSAFPNPASVSGTFSFTIPRPESVSLKLFDETGVNVATYFDGFAGPGETQVPFDATKLASGAYIAVLSTPEGSSTARIIVLPR